MKYLPAIILAAASLSFPAAGHAWSSGQDHSQHQQHQGAAAGSPKKSQAPIATPDAQAQHEAESGEECKCCCCKHMQKMMQEHGKMGAPMRGTRVSRRTRSTIITDVEPSMNIIALPAQTALLFGRRAFPGRT